MAEMIDRVARAIGEVYDGLADPELTPNNWARAALAARAAVDAMREPTDQMITAGWNNTNRPIEDHEDLYDIAYRAMIDEALK
jgi:hypothetical protein